MSSVVPSSRLLWSETYKIIISNVLALTMYVTVFNLLYVLLHWPTQPYYGKIVSSFLFYGCEDWRSGMFTCQGYQADKWGKKNRTQKSKSNSNSCIFNSSKPNSLKANLANISSTYDQLAKNSNKEGMCLGLVQRHSFGAGCKSARQRTAFKS